MNKYLKTIGKGLIDGIRHPFMQGFPKDVKNMDVGESLLYGSSMGLSQGVIQSGISVVLSIGILVGIGYVNSFINKEPINVKTIVDK